MIPALHVFCNSVQFVKRAARGTVNGGLHKFHCCGEMLSLGRGLI